jgi:hypothetical protein
MAIVTTMKGIDGDKMMDGWVIMEVLIRLDLVGILAISMKVIFIAAKVLGKNSRC